MEQRPLRLGDILDDYCPRERRVTNHAVVAMIEEDVKQTRCTTCDTEHVYKGGKPPRRKKADTTGAVSNIDVSDTARTLAALENHIGKLPVVNESRVDAVRRAMDEGRYHVDPQRVADKMLRFEVDLLATIPAHK